MIESENDEVVTPYTSAFLAGPNVTNILLQNQCALDQGEHLSMPYDHIADADVLTALDPRTAARRARRCCRSRADDARRRSAPVVAPAALGSCPVDYPQPGYGLRDPVAR